MTTSTQSAAVTNKYDTAIRCFYAIFAAIGLIVFVAVSLQYMTWQAWLFSGFGSVLGATALSLIVRSMINMFRDDQPVAKADVLIRVFYIVFFTIATVAFVSIGFQWNNTRTWIIAFVGAYAAALIYSTIARLIVTLARKDNRQAAA